MPRGFSDQPQAEFVVGPSQESVRPAVQSATVRVGPGGRVVIPAEMREAMNLDQGDAMLATLQGGELTLVTIKDRVRELQEITRKYVPEGVSLVDEFLAEKRAMWGEDE